MKDPKAIIPISTLKPYIFEDIFKGGHDNLYGYRYNEDISIHTMNFGVYRYVYGAPFAKIKYKTYVNNTEYYFYFFSIDDLNNIVTKNDMIDFCKDNVTKYIASLNEAFIDGPS